MKASPLPRGSGARRLFTLACTAAVTSVALTGAPTFAASHREAPFISRHPKVAGTDLYVFRSYEAGRGGFVTRVANYLPLQGAHASRLWCPRHRRPAHKVGH